MSIIAKGSETKDFERPEEGTYVGRCIHVVDLGTHDNEWQGKVNKRRQVMLVWEIDELMSDGKPFVVNWKGTLSLSNKANLRKFLEAWRGKKFTEEELEGFDLQNIIDKPCLVTITNSTSSQGKTFTNVDAVTKPIKNQEIPDRVNELVFFPITDIGTGDWDKLWEWQRNLIMKSDEYKEYSDEGRPFTEKQSEDDEEEIPF